MALSSSYKKLASRLAEWAYVEDRTQVRVLQVTFSLVRPFMLDVFISYNVSYVELQYE